MSLFEQCKVLEEVFPVSKKMVMKKHPLCFQMRVLQAASATSSRQSARGLPSPRNCNVSRFWNHLAGALLWNARQLWADNVHESLNLGRGGGRALATESQDGRPHVAVGMSGGVDSSVAALLLQRQGYKVTGLYMRNWDPQDEQGTEVCTAEQDYKDAKAVCHQLGIPLLHVDYHRQYWSHVFEPLVNDYALGLTPNPDLHCNKHIKFDALLKHCWRIGAERLATGHYARVEMSREGTAQLLRAVDRDKDQTYFLASVSGEALRHAMFPIGTYTKSEVRKIAGSAGLPVACKRSSAGICFVGRRHFPDFISGYLETTPGNFISVSDGSVAGTHAGAALYTNGQRARISGAAEPWFVVGKEMHSNKVFVAQGQNHGALYCRSAVADSLFWVSGQPPAELAAGKSMTCTYKARYSQEADHCSIALSHKITDVKLGLGRAVCQAFRPSAFCVLHERPGRSGGDVLEIHFSRPAKAITPGQAIVLYDGEVCLGGGLIAHPGPSIYEESQHSSTQHGNEESQAEA